MTGSLWIVVLSVVVGACMAQKNCPYHFINGAENLSWMNMTHSDILYGTILENKTMDDIVALCRSQKLGKTVDEVNGFIDRCKSDDADKTLAVFNINGFKEAVQYLCNNENMKILEDNIACMKENIPALNDCRAARMNEAYSTDGEDEKAKACSQQRAHSYCSDQVLSSKCDKKLADLKIKMADLIISPACGCDQIVERRDLSRCSSDFCMTIDGESKGEEEMYNSLLFGANGVEKIHDICKSTQDGRSYQLVTELKRCMERTCNWRDYNYKFQIYDKAAVIKAAEYFCESQNFLFPAAKCIRSSWDAYSDCLEKGLAEEQQALETEERQDMMNDYICRRRVVTAQCISDHFSNCETDIYARLNDLWLSRAPRMCRTDCQPIGFGGSATMTSSIAAIFGLLATTLLLIFK